jgi:hypothetical protein
MNNRAPKLKKTDSVAPRGSSPSSSNSSSNSDGSLIEGKIVSSPSDDNPKPVGVSRGKRKKDELNLNSGSDKTNKVQKTVTFSQESNTTTRANVNSTRIGTRSTIGSGEAVLLPDLPVKRKVTKGKSVRKDDNVTVVKMLTGTLYLLPGDRPRAEFVRFK